MNARAGRPKNPDAFRTISEAAAEVGVAAHVLRFWETKFSILRPLKRGGNRRYYRSRDIEILYRIKRLLHDEGYTIKGAAKALRSGGGDDNVLSLGSDDSDGGMAEPDPNEPFLPLGIDDASGMAREQRDGVSHISDLLAALATECADVAAGNPPPTSTD